MLAGCGQQRRAAAGPWLLPMPLVPAALLAAARGPGRPGLRRYRQGRLACLASDRGKGPVGPEEPELAQPG